MSIKKINKKKRVCLVITALYNLQVCEEFRDVAYEKLEGQALTGNSIVSALHAAANVVLPIKKASQRKPWISQRILDLLHARNNLRIKGRYIEEIKIKKIKAAY